MESVPKERRTSSGGTSSTSRGSRPPTAGATNRPTRRSGSQASHDEKTPRSLNAAGSVRTAAAGGSHSGPSATSGKAPSEDELKQMERKAEAGVPLDVLQAVLQKSTDLSTPTVKGYDFNMGIDYDILLGSYYRSGYQAQHFGKAVREIERMLDWNLGKENIPEDEVADFKKKSIRERVRTKIFLGYTSNLVSSGLRENIRFLVQHRMVHVLVSTAGGIEEDLIKCMAPTHMGEFTLDGKDLRAQGLNRIGNLLVPNKNYCLFEDWLGPLIHKMHDIQDQTGVHFTPSSMIHFLGKEINDEESICFWAYKKNIPVFCPAITDGSLGDMIYFHSYRREGFVVDIAKDIRLVNDEARNSRKTGCIILGGGLIKHHIMNANLMRNGADFAVYVSTAQEYDGCDSGARPDEAKSWGKIRVDANPVKVHGDATLIFPLLVAQTFAKKFHRMGEKAFRDDMDKVIFEKSFTDLESDFEKKKIGEYTPELEM